jgi:hypothetical protein
VDTKEDKGEEMSYCRWGGDSDVYIYPTFNRGIVCCACRLKSSTGGLHEDFAVELPAQMLSHLKEHIEAGQRVPDYAISRLKKECGHG